MINSALSIAFSPLLSPALFYTLVTVAVILLGLSARYYQRGLLTRAVCVSVFLLLLANPSVVQEQRRAVPDIAVLALDHSPSQQIGDRTDQTEKAAKVIQEKIAALPGIELRVAESSTSGALSGRETTIFDDIDNALTDVPLSRRAGVVIVSDGQIHDIPTTSRKDDYGPVHLLLTGRPSEKDRQLVILEAPSYGIVDQDITIRYRIEEPGAKPEQTATLHLQTDDQPPRSRRVPVNTDLSLTVKISHAGQNIVDLSVSALKEEMTEINNRVPLIINGVRDRLRVLLISGRPYAGGRTWRNLLTADPGVDLVHFTILREPQKFDATPQSELSLIAFPFQELFEVKLYDFDLIIFDRYRLNRILPSYYFNNIARYVRQGGALLITSGPDFATENSIYATSLSDIIPAYPTGEIYEKTFKPIITKTGHRHPVTQGLSWAGESSQQERPVWGPWMRHVSVMPKEGDVLMAGAEDKPLLILNRVDKGRIAQLASDQIWLWSRGYEGGGPQAELLRRLAHWLMKEPELEENALMVREEEGALVIQRRALEADEIEVTVTDPDHEKKPVTLTRRSNGLLEGRLPVGPLGIYSVDDGMQKRLALVGAVNPPELSAVITTDKKAKPFIEATKGGIYWIAEEGVPTPRLIPRDRDYSGRNWLGLRSNNSYDITGVTDRPLLSPWVSVLLALSALLLAWRREGRSRHRASR